MFLPGQKCLQKDSGTLICSVSCVWLVVNFPGFCWELLVLIFGQAQTLTPCQGVKVSEDGIVDGGASSPGILAYKTGNYK